MDADRFDVLTRTVSAPLSRRITLSGLAAGVLVALGLALDERTVLAKKKQGKKGKGKGKKKGKKKPVPTTPPPPPCSQGACQREFVLQDNRDYCEFICRQCDRNDPRQFCIIENDPTNPDNKVAVCCAEGSDCCGYQCCPYPQLPSCCNGTCTNTANDPANCGECGNRCPNGWVCQPTAFGGRCQGCGDGPPCTGGQLCWDGEHCSDCPPGEKLCQTRDRPDPRCVPETAVCCPGFTCGDPSAHCCVSASGFGYCSIGGECPT